MGSHHKYHKYSFHHLGLSPSLLPNLRVFSAHLRTGLRKQRDLPAASKSELHTECQIESQLPGGRSPTLTPCWKWKFLKASRIGRYIKHPYGTFFIFLYGEIKSPSLVCFPSLFFHTKRLIVQIYKTRGCCPEEAKACNPCKLCSFY